MRGVRYNLTWRRLRGRACACPRAMCSRTGSACVQSGADTLLGPLSCLMAAPLPDSSRGKPVMPLGPDTLAVLPRAHPRTAAIERRRPTCIVGMRIQDSRGPVSLPGPNGDTALTPSSPFCPVSRYARQITEMRTLAVKGLWRFALWRLISVVAAVVAPGSWPGQE